MKKNRFVVEDWATGASAVVFVVILKKMTNSDAPDGESTASRR
jgi:hypothetical protein